MTDPAPFPRVDGIHALTVPLPGFPDLICSNMFVLGDGPVTLIDSAPKFPGSLFTMEGQLEKIGFTWAHVERIVLTHGHIDHFGLVGSIRGAASHHVPCHIHEDDLWRLSSSFLRSGMWSDDVDEFSARAGMPAGVVERMRRRSHFFKNLCDPVDDALPMRDGDRFSGPGFELEVIHTPGHSPGCCCLYERRSRVLFSGDHLLKHITPNPFHETNRSRLRDPAYKSLKSYMASLDKLEPLDIRYAFPAHGEFIEDVTGLLEGYRDHHRARTETILSALGHGAHSVYDLAGAVFPSAEESEAFLAVSEIIVHLEILLEEDRARLADQGPPALYEAV